MSIPILFLTDKNKKSFSIGSKGYTRSLKKVKEELDKCDCLCANCHRTIHHEQKMLEVYGNINMKAYEYNPKESIVTDLDLINFPYRKTNNFNYPTKPPENGLSVG